MTATQQFIEDAIKGGWKLGGTFEVSRLGDKYNAGTFMFCTLLNPDTGKSWSSHLNEGDFLLDPLAWQAVGKTRVWSPYGTCTDCGEPACVKEYCGNTAYRNQAIAKQHQFIDHLADGLSIEEALSKLV